MAHAGRKLPQSPASWALRIPHGSPCLPKGVCVLPNPEYVATSKSSWKRHGELLYYLRLFSELAIKFSDNSLQRVIHHANIELRREGQFHLHTLEAVGHFFR